MPFNNFVAIFFLLVVVCPHLFADPKNSGFRKKCPLKICHQATAAIPIKQNITYHIFDHLGMGLASSVEPLSSFHLCSL